MSQRECAGFNWPPLSISAAEPVSICPEAVNRAGPGSCVSVSLGSDGLNCPCPSVWWSRAFGVGHPQTNFVSAGRPIVTFDPSGIIPVGETPILGPLPPFPSLAAGLSHPVQSVADMRRTDARRRKRDTPEGVTQGFHVSVYKVDPSIDSLACNLLSKDD